MRALDSRKLLCSTGSSSRGLQLQPTILAEPWRRRATGTPPAAAYEDRYSLAPTWPRTQRSRRVWIFLSALSRLDGTCPAIFFPCARGRDKGPFETLLACLLCAGYWRRRRPILRREARRPARSGEASDPPPPAPAAPAAAWLRATRVAAAPRRRRRPRAVLASK